MNKSAKVERTGKGLLRWSALLAALREYAKRHDPESRMSHLRLFDDGSGRVYRNRLDREGTGFRGIKDALKVMRS